MMPGETVVRALQPGDREAWEPLWQGYLTFYKATLASDVTDATWRRFFDPLERLGAFVAERDGRLIGIAHYLLHRSTWAPLCYCYLEDLFVEPSARGSGAGRALIAAVEAAAREAGASRLYWITHETNQTAQNLYNQVAERPGFVQYRKKL
ncbi:GNAT family N-acetyltransferase [Bradyrhizobium sp. URHD0069]|uniref:GNAT family N-acetyltransferase n=1 Tax=Bradyrhizobium sp. URHD0069 TaxID=1380355 RepID=UPI000495203A